MREWTAETYHKVSDPMFGFAMPVLARLSLRGNETVLDVGCGTGRVTEKLLERLPAGRVIGVELSWNMLAVAKHYLSRYNGRVRFALADASALPVSAAADAIFSTATFHWVHDHPRLFRSLYAALKPGGQLVAQCGGGPNIRRLHDRCNALMRTPDFAPYFRRWWEPWEFADAKTTAKRQREAGFTDIRTSVEYAPVGQPNAPAFKEFIATVICRPHLACLPEPSLRARFVDFLADQAAADDPPYELDYWRLNMDARRPS